MSINVEARDEFVKSSTVPTECFLIHAPDDFNLGKILRGQVYVGLNDDSTHKTYCVGHATKVDKVLKDEAKNRILLRMSMDGGGDRKAKLERA